MFQAMSQEADKRQQETNRQMKESREAWERDRRERAGRRASGVPPTVRKDYGRWEAIDKVC
jgi:hypothetical protein